MRLTVSVQPIKFNVLSGKYKALEDNEVTLQQTGELLEELTYQLNDLLGAEVELSNGLNLGFPTDEMTQVRLYNKNAMIQVEFDRDDIAGTIEMTEQRFGHESKTISDEPE